MKERPAEEESEGSTDPIDQILEAKHKDLLLDDDSGSLRTEEEGWGPINFPVYLLFADLREEKYEPRLLGLRWSRNSVYLREDVLVKMTLAIAASSSS